MNTRPSLIPESDLHPDDFPDSPYAAEIRRGVSNSAFIPAIEAEYLRMHLRRVHTRVRIWFTLTACISALFIVMQIRTSGFWSGTSLLHLLLLGPSVVVLPFIVWTKYYDRFFIPAARAIVPVTACAIAVFVAEGAQNGEDLASLVLNLFALFFFSGLMYRVALASSIAMLISFSAAAYAYHLPAEVNVNGLLWLAITMVIAAIVSREVERSYRKNFLEGALIRQLASRDGLTGVMNRRAFDDHLRRIWQHALRDKRAIAVMMIDIDHFKAYNDRWGHQAGDTALRAVARTIQSFSRRPLDMAARYGGEEFVVILYDPGAAQLMLVAEQLRHAVELLHIEHAAPGAGPEVTISVGVGLVAPEIGRTPEGAVQFADEALYEAKQAGRNRVVVRSSDEYLNLKTGTFHVAGHLLNETGQA